MNNPQTNPWRVIPSAAIRCLLAWTLLTLTTGALSFGATTIDIQRLPSGASVWGTTSDPVLYRLEVSPDLTHWIQTGAGTLHRGERRRLLDHSQDFQTTFFRLQTEPITAETLAVPVANVDPGVIGFAGSEPTGVLAVALERADASGAFLQIDSSSMLRPMFDDQPIPGETAQYRLVYTLSSGEAMATIPVSVNTPLEPPAPRGFSATQLSPASVRFNWDCSGTAPGTGYILEISSNGTDFESLVESDDLECSHLEEDFPFTGTAILRLRYVNAAGESAPSATVSMRVEERVEKAASVRASANSHSSARVVWGYEDDEGLERFEIWQRRDDASGFSFGENVLSAKREAVRTGLSSGHDYCFRVVAVALDGRRSGLSEEEGCAHIPRVEPPTAMRATQLSITSAQVTWRNNAGSVDRFEIWQSVNGGGWGLGENVPPDRESAIRDGLTPGWNYCFKVRAIKEGQESPFSDPSCLDLIFPAPDLVRSSLSGPKAVRICWRNNAADVDRFEIIQSRDGGPWTFGENVPPSVDCAVRDNLAVGSRYCFKVRAIKGSHETSYSDETCETILFPAPILTSAGLSGSESVRICWSNPAGDVEKFEIWQSRDGGGWEFGENVPPSVNCATRDGLLRDHTYRFKVRSYRQGDNSPFSDPSGDVFVPPPPPIAPPTGVSARNEETAARVSWVNNAGAVERFEIYQSVDGGPWVFGENVPPDRTSAVREPLQPRHNYCFKVRAFKDGRYSEFSAGDCVDVELIRPANVTVERAAKAAIRVNWTYSGSTPTRFEIWQSKDGGSYTFGENVSPERRNAVRDGLSIGHNYCFKVLAVKSGFDSRLSSSSGCMDAPAR